MARENAQQHGVAERAEFFQGDLLADLPADARFDMVVSNPPYVSQPEWEQLPATVKNYEPREALVGGPTGVETIARLVPQAAERLQPGGWLLLEISPMIEAAARQEVDAEGRFEPATIRKDLAGLPRVLRARKKT